MEVGECQAAYFLRSVRILDGEFWQGLMEPHRLKPVLLSSSGRNAACSRKRRKKTHWEHLSHSMVFPR